MALADSDFHCEVRDLGPIMGKDKLNPSGQQPKMDKFTVSGPPEQNAVLGDAVPDRFSEVLSAIQASRQSLENQIGGVQLDVSLVRQDLLNVVDRVTEAEGRISELEVTLKVLDPTVQKLTATTGALEARADVAENCALCWISRRS